MNSHKHARLTPYGRALLVRRMLEEGLRPEEAAQAAGVSVRTANKWCRRYLGEAGLGLQDRSSRPASCTHQTLEALSKQIIALRRERRTDPPDPSTHRGVDIHHWTGAGPATVSQTLHRRATHRL